ncbi:hypothetical protein B0T19DRAFT_215086 [Cercophora scortea]|uniref:BHLH domain-containing protein n=1 Tax=Cercophora scortea TaxID=314031 RepID=A0AAE0MAF1_9PEZI|nr:hypothetical protein B0T19DRAFT_215086 [Cercophora scortea]
MSPLCQPLRLESTDLAGELDFMPWSAADPSYSPNVYVDEAPYEYFPMLSPHPASRGLPGDSNSSEGQESASLPSIDYFPGREFLPPGTWTGATDSDTGTRELFCPAPDTTAAGWAMDSPAFSNDGDLFKSHLVSFGGPIADSASPPPMKRARPSAADDVSVSSSTLLSSSLAQATTMPKLRSSKRSSSSPSSTGAGAGAGTGTNGHHHKAQLRTASRRPKSQRKASVASSLSPSIDDAEEAEMMLLTPEERRARHNHNVVEKQYRNRLNVQFERLLAALPTAADQRADADALYDMDGRAPESCAVVDEKRLSKAEVLDMATRRIKALEKERRHLQQERAELLQNVELITNSIGQSRIGRSG